MSRSFEARLQSVRTIMETRGFDSLRLSMQRNVSWLMHGRSHVNTASEPACCMIVITKNVCALLSNNIESRRLVEEELPADALPHLTEIAAWPWHEPSRRDELARELAPESANAAGDAEIEAELLALRVTVSEDELPEYRELALLARDAIEEAAFGLVRGETEYQASARLASAGLTRGLEPIVNLVASDERIWTRRHPLPTSRSIDKHAMLVTIMRRRGLCAAATRIVHFGTPDDELVRRQNAAAEIDARLMAETRPGKTLGELFERMRKLYADAGYADEWTFHHQGGLMGYQPRERLALPGDGFRVAEGQLFAWNPSIAGTKSEDTLLIGKAGNEIATKSREFPVIEVKAEGRIWARPGLLIR